LQQHVETKTVRQPDAKADQQQARRAVGIGGRVDRR